ncbi:MAG TPA: WD40 repeat domain-containing protein, partial [Gemmataceae bacterium]
ASVGEDATLRLWDAATRRLLRICKGHRHSVLSVAFSPDGKVVASGSNDDHEVRLWDVSTGKTIRVLGDHHQGHFEHMAFSPDGKTLVSQGDWEGFRLWDVATGKPIRDFVQKGGVSAMAFSPDGETIATVSSPEMNLALWRTATGKRIRRWEGPDREVHVVVFSPVGNVFATCGWNARTRIWDAATGRETRVCGGRARSLAFSPDGRTLFSAMGNTFHLWETATGQEIRGWKGHQGWNTAVAFSPDGRTVASGNGGTTILLWDAFPSRAASLKTSPIPRRDLQPLWSDLASDAARAYAAIIALSRQPRTSVAFLQQHLRPIDPLKAGALESLIADLDSDDFARREKAQVELARLGELALPALRRGLAGHPSLEKRRRMERALKEAADAVASSEHLRALRAITVLEWADTAEARKLLARLAAGAAEARFTQEAKAALDRLAKRPGPKPNRTR